jgi:hypothetical protein
VASVVEDPSASISGEGSRRGTGCLELLGRGRGPRPFRAQLCQIGRRRQPGWLQAADSFVSLPSTSRSGVVGNNCGGGCPS